MTCNIDTAVAALRAGSVIAYPTESCYGLGADPNSEAAVYRILKLKQRAVAQGFIVIAADWSQVAHWVDIQAVPPERYHTAQASWPGAITWVWPAAPMTPNWLTGTHDTIALRLTQHPVAQALCQAFGPLVSTSANPHGQPACYTKAALEEALPNGIAVTVNGQPGGLQPTPIYAVMTGQQLR